jgi:hypothetical protein
MSRSAELAARAVRALASDASIEKRLVEAAMHLGFINQPNREQELTPELCETLDQALREDEPLYQRAENIATAIVEILRHP